MIQQTTQANALTYDMIYTQPVVYELGLLRVPTLLIIGQDDRTVVGKAKMPENLRSAAGNYPELGKRAQAAIPASSPSANGKNASDAITAPRAGD